MQEKTPQNMTIRKKFNTDKFADYKERIVDSDKRFTNTRFKTSEIINPMPDDVRTSPELRFLSLKS